MALENLTKITSVGISSHIALTGVTTVGFITSADAWVGGALTVGGNITIGGTITYEDVTNIDSVGIITSQNGLRVTAGGINVTAGVSTYSGLVDVNNRIDVVGGANIDQVNVTGVSTFSGNTNIDSDTAKLQLGTSQDLQLYHNNNLSTIKNTHANGVAVRSNVIMLQNAAGDHDYLSTANEAGVSLFYDNAAKFVTTNTGAVVTGILTATSFSGGLPITNGADNRVITASSSSAIQGESSLTFDGTTLMNAGGTITAERGAIPSIEAKNSTDTSYARFYCSQTSGSGGYAAFQKLGTNSSAIGGANATQIWCTGDAPLVIGVNNGERLRIDANGWQSGHTAYAGVGINTFASWARTGGAIRGEVGYNAVTLDYMYFGTGTTHPLALRTGNTTALLIDNNQKIGIGTINPYAPLSLLTAPAASNASNLADKGILLHAPGATDEQIIPISASFVTNAHLPRCAIGFISHPTADPIQGYAGEIGFYTRDGADGSAVNPTDERMRISRSGRVGIGTDNIGGKLDIHSSSAGSVNPDGDANELVLESSDKTGMSILSPGSGESSIYFGNPGTNGQKDGWLKYYHETHSNNAKQRSLQIKAGGGEVAYFNSTGLVMSNDKGISFINADDTATGETVSSSVLDDYEEGTCTMSYSPASGSFAAHIYTSGKYTKIGNIVTVTGSISLNGNTNASGRVDIIGWPYAPISINSTWSLESGHGVIKGHYGYPDAFNMVVMNNGGTNAYVYKEDGTYLQVSNMSTGYNESQCSFTVTYMASA